MIISKTPFRISFVGGGSDLEAFYARHTGAVLSTSIDKYMYISSHKFFEPDKIRTKYSRTETVDRVADLQHPILRVALEKFGIQGGIEISSIADVPSGTGMGSSSSFTVGVLHNLYAVQNHFVSKEQLAAEACEIEIDILKEPIGKQDQYAAAYGGLNVIEFLPNGRVAVNPVFLGKDALSALDRNLIMFYVGNQRKASDILSQQRKNTSAEDKFNALKQMVSLVYELRDELLKGNLDAMGKMLHENWLIKQGLASGISNPEINAIYETGLKNGAIGGKLLGAGGGGFMLFYCPVEKQDGLKKALSNVRPFDFTFEQDGSKIIHFSHG
ncbi:MAG: GHMP kinase [Bacteroidota bacterium]|nr:GHMP kinase [Bacteroidota bacterium]MDX5427854.1 GHMP kinase [Bacteroidota bacterium]MDX5447026.1 GHMP kinase [Bacteroidota bacterium]MDX5505732.1 GHMP kinase [Bacteroidota bacterium]